MLKKGFDFGGLCAFTEFHSMDGFFRFQIEYRRQTEKLKSDACKDKKQHHQHNQQQQ